MMKQAKGITSFAFLTAPLAASGTNVADVIAFTDAEEAAYQKRYTQRTYALAGVMASL